MSGPSNTSPSLADGKTFDYIIVGGGTAGLAVAARLTEDPSISVVVLEAGAAAFDDRVIDVPGRYGEAINTDLDWQYSTVPQSGLRGRKLPWPRGKVLGGTSALNFMAWNRPNRADLDAWDSLGNKGWSWDDLQSFYRRSEHFTAPSDSKCQEHSLKTDSSAMGTSGPISVCYLSEYSLSHKYWHQTLNNLGVNTNERHMSGSNVGVWTNMVAVESQTCRRSYSATAYYLPCASRPNLTVITEAAAREVILEQGPDGWTAKAVRYNQKGVDCKVNASGEVVICAGTIASSQLLELSGVGDPAVLEASGISVKVGNANVGRNVQDHMMTATIFEVDPATPTQDDLKTDAALAAEADKSYLASRSGLRAVLPGSFCYLSLSQFIPTEKLVALAKRADRLPSTRANILRSQRLSEDQSLGFIEYIFDLGNWSPFVPAESGKKYATLLQILQYPFSHGTIHINPDNPTGSPLIDPQYYSGPNGALDLDIQTLCAEYIGRKIVSTAPLKDMIIKPISPATETPDSDELKAWIVDNTIIDWHPVGSCSMGGYQGAEGGVVDERLRVYGVTGLRVVDASVMPMQISAHVQATVYAIAEKGSEMIVEDRNAMKEKV